MSRAFRMARRGSGRSTKRSRVVFTKRGVTQSQKTHSRKFSSHEPRAIFAETRLRAFRSVSRESVKRRNRVFYFSPTPSFVCVFSHVAIPKALVVYFQYVVLLGQDEIVHPWGSSRVHTPDRAARTPRDTLARVRSLARHATRAFVKRRTRLPRLVLRGP